MRRITLMLTILIPLTGLAQFWAPTGLEFYYYYFPIDDGGYCNGQVITGPAYCSYFNWNAPDTLPVKANLLNYKLYFQHLAPNDSSVECFATVSDTFFIVPSGFIGKMWVTAVYDNPSGESDSSNIVINNSLPIGIAGPTAKEIPKIWYDYSGAQVKVEEGVSIREINLYNELGQLVKSASNTNLLSIKEMPSGVYIAEVKNKNPNLVFRKKIVK